MIKILIMGLPGSGKTFLAGLLYDCLLTLGKSVLWLNADKVRTQFNDWDFSIEGRLQQSKRMALLANESTADYVICDFVAPLEEMRKEFAADWIIWMDTITESRFDDTNQIFTAPTRYNFRLRKQHSEEVSQQLANYLVNNE